VAGSCVQGSKYKDYIKVGQFLVKLSNYKTLKKAFSAECINSKK
jgi:hypothetical protein